LLVLTVGIVEAPAIEAGIFDPTQHFVCGQRCFPRLELNGSHEVIIGFDASQGGFEISFDVDTIPADDLAWAVDSAEFVAK
jgi:hypothetical protein